MSLQNNYLTQTGLTKGTTSTTNRTYEVPQSAKTVKYTQSGLVAPKFPIVYCPTRFVDAAVAADFNGLNADGNIYGGVYFDAAVVNLLPQTVDNLTAVINFGNAVTQIVFPSATALLARLRDINEFENVPAGFRWTISFLKRRVNPDIALTPGADMVLLSDPEFTGEQRLFTFVFNNTTPGFESYVVY